MAESNSHRFGQIIGDLLELAIEPRLRRFAKENNLFLDKKGERIARSGKKLTWIDIKNNKHDLDFVLERGGTEEKLGVPVAFIESAWRRYTKHSRNKAQEIQGAILPLLEKYSHVSPYAGVVLAGVFTEGSLTQLRSQGFGVLYFPYESVIESFSRHGIDASFDEDTTEDELKSKVKAVEQFGDLTPIAMELIRINGTEADLFFTELAGIVARHIESIVIWPLHGSSSKISTIEEAIQFLKTYTEDQDLHPFVKYEIFIRYNTGTVINGVFVTKSEAIDFLNTQGAR